MYLRNTWYVAAWDSEITREPRQIKVLGEKIVTFRTEAGDPVALMDACPHRKLPLSKGRIKGDNIECGYHGLTFDCAGSCVRVPGQDRIPPSANVHSYPVISRYGLVWIWMGDPALADPDTIFEVEHFDDPDWGMNRGDAMPFPCNYLLITDNLLDPSHVAWVHQSSFGSAACEEEPLTVTGTESGVIVSRWMYDTEVAPFYQKLVPFEGNCDREQHYEVRYPSLAYIKAIFTPAGTGGDASNLPEGQYFQMDSYNFMTPVDEKTTRYYWFQMRNVRPGDDEIAKYMSDSVLIAFNEDRDILIEVQKGMDEKITRNIDIAIDAGPLLYRRRLQKLIDAEAKQEDPENA
ncbi:aromatic ring-hydroxylating dioxygenase subunit alpha [Roseovarius aestuarii]|uniref:Toluene-4-sulfonate monooxygenase system iron-sulfur subunit TsaM1 n=1 Tax=Roseovarius aestuarii TaxID=475083 RepID=A0A1X7BP16_9RHOB|nr:aromatic ring-hydroxylating dioxygenase subunit alpha [Roseovarius aestuarii]SMC11294.1 Toluene-4-sulfonate monooxygenase system iron-sulfur subunit TsaM1 [Roseovarius aestuarii]